MFNLAKDIQDDVRALLGRLTTCETFTESMGPWTVAVEQFMLEAAAACNEVPGLLTRMGTAESGIDALLDRMDAADLAISGKASSAHSHAYADITGKPALFSGAYADLSGKPTIPAAQVQSDWNQATNTAADYVKNKPAKVFSQEVTIAGGNAVFHMTVDGTAGGAAFLPSGVDVNSFQFTALEGNSPVTFGAPVLSNGGKTVTVPATRLALVIAVLTLGQSANGVSVRMMCKGAS